MAEQRLQKCLANLRKALLVMHSPTDDLVGIDNASAIFTAAKHPKSFISLSGADHLLGKRADGVYVADVIAAWSERYLDMVPQPDMEPIKPCWSRKPAMAVRAIHDRRPASVSRRRADIGRRKWHWTEPVRISARRARRLYVDDHPALCRAQELPLRRVAVRLKHDKIHAVDCENCETKESKIDRIDREVTLEGDLSAEQRARLMEIADKCPVHRTLHSEIEVHTREAA